VSIIAEAVRHLIAAGVTGDALVTAIADMEAAQKPARSSAAVRQARYRDREKERNALRHVDNVRNSETPEPPSREEYNTTRAPAVIPVGISNDIPPIDSPLPTVGTPKPEKTKNPTPQEILSEVVSEKTAADVVAHRKALRKPLTPRAAELLAKTLAASGDAEHAAATMIERGWQGYRADWDSAKPNARAGPYRQPEKRNTVFQAAQEMMAELYGGTDGTSERPSDDFNGTTLDLALEPGDGGCGSRGTVQAYRNDGAAGGERPRHEGDVIDLHGPRGRFASG
jgi:hypothetical protein